MLGTLLEKGGGLREENLFESKIKAKLEKRKIKLTQQYLDASDF